MVYHLAFSARIRTGSETFKQVVIEVQKAKFATDIMRLWRYLGDQTFFLVFLDLVLVLDQCEIQTGPGPSPGPGPGNLLER